MTATVLAVRTAAEATPARRISKTLSNGAVLTMSATRPADLADLAEIMEQGISARLERAS